MLTSRTFVQILSKGAELPRQPPTHPEETEEELTETTEMQDERGEGLDHVREGRQKDSSGETTPPSERLVPLKGESTESELEEDDDEDEAIELRECDEEGAPYGQVRAHCLFYPEIFVCKLKVKSVISAALGVIKRHCKNNAHFQRFLERQWCFNMGKKMTLRNFNVIYRAANMYFACLASFLNF